MLDRDPTEPPVQDAATLLWLRDGAEGVEVFCVQRHHASRFMGGAIVFPGGKVDPSDRDAAWIRVTTPPREGGFAPDEETCRALAIAACRESLEEAALLPLCGGGQAALEHDVLLAVRSRGVEGASLRAWLLAEGRKVDLWALHPWSRWVTPVAEARRYDTRFFAVLATGDAQGAHDNHETTASFWSTPRALLDRFDRGEARIAPPTHRMLSLLVGIARAEDAIEQAGHACRDPICPELVPRSSGDEETPALVLPGDRDHSVKEVRVAGPSRFVLRGGVWRP